MSPNGILPIFSAVIHVLTIVLGIDQQEILPEPPLSPVAVWRWSAPRVS